MDTKYESALLLDEEPELFGIQAKAGNTRKCRCNLCGVLLVISLALNIFQGIGVLHFTNIPTGQANNLRTKYAGLKQDEIQHLWTHENPYTSQNTTERHQHWDSINIDRGLIALPTLFASEKGIPIGSTFPWNHNKSLYLINAYHGLHCLKNIYQAFMEYQEGRSQSFEGGHIIHCLDQLRLDILCNADDTPRTTTPDMTPVTAKGQFRSCRNWDALVKWVDSYPSCYRYGNAKVEDMKPSQLSRMRFCPEGSEELQKVRIYFGEGQDWKPADEKKWSWFDEM
ncbi:hypothetical protein HYFRA_00003077 [Hymenoscyphus fraxineus]|uniref:Uncharacterized protein n=1 Tax=Hymenoscyphus fraxineus TaxID=746836 RepID=A0A9N9KN31_9HELO|nr:hypothetical protein HYFRA_00003077 [Hymenoscyphus fraxineus]